MALPLGAAVPPDHKDRGFHFGKLLTAGGLDRTATSHGHSGRNKDAVNSVLFPVSRAAGQRRGQLLADTTGPCVSAGTQLGLGRCWATRLCQSRCRSSRGCSYCTAVSPYS